jgi:PIN domain nuclease of toxin-antitoxin system
MAQLRGDLFALDTSALLTLCIDEEGAIEVERILRRKGKTAYD